MSSEARQVKSPRTRNSTTLQPTSNRRLFILSVLTLILAALVAFFWCDTVNLFAFRRLFGSSSRAASSSTGSVSAPVLASSSIAATSVARDQQESETSEQSGSKMKTPVYFLSHGGVSFGICLGATWEFCIDYCIAHYHV